MTVCVYPTDGNWITTLHENQVKNNVNFWRGDTRAIHLMPGTCFYFKIRGSMKIAGRCYLEKRKQCRFPTHGNFLVLAMA